MKKVVLGMFVAAIASQAAGCIIVSDDDDDGGDGSAARIEASWEFTSLAGTDTGCPPNIDTIRTIVQEVDANGAPVGAEIPDSFDCFDFSGVTAPLPPGRVSIYLEAATGDGAAQFTSFTQFTDITDVNKSLSFDFVSDGGFITMDWELDGGTTNAALECSDVPELTDPDAGVGMLVTVSGTAEAHDFQFDCEAHQGTSDALAPGAYVVSIDAFNAQNQSLSVDAVNKNATVTAPNGIANVGSVLIPIEGE